MNALKSATAVFELVQQFYHATEIGRLTQPMRSALALISRSRQNTDNCFGLTELSRNTI